jgi:hypothetical protein
MSVIDKKGLSHAIRTAMAVSLGAIEHSVVVAKVLLDGSLYAQHYVNQEYYQGDEKTRNSLALMVQKSNATSAALLAKSFQMRFEKHKTALLPRGDEKNSIPTPPQSF